MSTGYAMRAMVAENIPDNSVTSATIVDGQVTTYDIADNAVTSAKIQDGSISFVDIGPNGASANQVIKRNVTNTGWTLGADEYIPDTDWTESGGNVYRASGNVGIGVSNPGYPLHVKNASGDTEVQFEADSGKVRFNLNAADDSYLDFQANTVSKPTVGYEAGGDYLCLQKGAGTANMAVLKGGNVGIGVTSPTSKLHVEGDMRVDQKVMADSGNVGIGTASPSAKLHVAGPIRLSQQILADDASGLDLATDDGVSRVKIADSGNVGVGTASPDYPLHVFRANGDMAVKMESNNGESHLIMDSTTGTPAVEFQVNGTYKGSVGYAIADDRMFVHQAVGGNVVFKNGKVGIGALTPSAGLDIANSSGLKVGANGIKLTEIREVTGTTASSGSYTTISLPSGYTHTNTRVLCAQVYEFEVIGEFFRIGYWHDRLCSVREVEGTGHQLYLDHGSLTSEPYRVTIAQVQ